MQLFGIYPIRKMSNKAIMFMGVLFGLFLVWLPNSSAESNCCQNVKKELDLTYKRMCGCPGYKLQFPRRNTNDYVKVTGVPDMTAITTCFWVNTTQSSTFVSYANARTDNALRIYSRNDEERQFGLFLNSYHVSLRIQLNDGIWHHVCVTWQSQNGQYSVYKDGNFAAEGTFTSTIDATLLGGGTLVLGQDQDDIGGGFDIYQAFKGELAEVNIWDSILPSAKILEMSKSCRPSSEAEGNVKAWSDFQSGIIAGEVKTLKSTCCNLEN